MKNVRFVCGLAAGLMVVCGWQIKLIDAGTPKPAPRSAIFDKPAFSVAPADMRAEAKRILASDQRYSDAAVTVLHEEKSDSYDAQGRIKSHVHVIAIINSQQGVDNWGELSIDYAPFHQDRPTVRIRVINPDGATVEVDPKLVVENPAATVSVTVVSDTRELLATLPRLVLGSIIEEEYTIRDNEPLLAAGQVRTHFPGRSIPVHQEKIVLSSPLSLPLHVVARGFDRTPQFRAPIAQSVTAGGRVTFTYNFEPSFGAPTYQDDAPHDLAQSPTLLVSTATSWAAVIHNYNSLVEPKIASGVVIPLDLKAAATATNMVNVVRWVHERVHYTNISCSRATIVPATPADTLSRGVGDCKDKTSLLVAALRSAGIQADLALLSTGPGLDIERTSPGLGVFDHSIVRAIVDGKPLWIDATEDLLPPGVLPARDQGRLALVLNGDEKGLQKTPILGPADTVIHVVRDFELVSGTGATLVETTTQTGSMFQDLRSWVLESKPDVIDNSLTTYTSDEYHGTYVGFHAANPSDTSAAFAFSMDATSVNRVYTDRNGVDVYMFASSAMGHLPAALRSDNDYFDTEAAQRTVDYVVAIPHRMVIENRIRLTPDFEPPTLVARSEQQIGAFTLVATRAMQGNIVNITYTFETTKTRLTPDEFRATRKAVRAMYTADAEHVAIVERTRALTLQGKHLEAIAQAQQQIAAAPSKALAYDRLTAAFINTGMGQAARRAAKKATQVEPSNADAFAMLGWALSRDDIARFRGAGFARNEAIAAYEKALKLNPDHAGAQLELGRLYLADSDDRFAAVSDLRRAVAHLQRAAELKAGDVRYEQIAAAWFRIGDLEQAETAAAKIVDVDVRVSELAAIAAMRNGGAFAIKQIDALNLSEKKRDVALKNAASELFSMRNYSAGIELHAAMSDASTAKGLGLVGKIRRRNLSEFDRKKPETVVMGCLLKLMNVSLLPCPWRDDSVRAQFEAKNAMKPMAASLKNLSVDEVVDFVAAMLEIKAVEGTAATGWRVLSEVNGQRQWCYLVVEGGKIVMIAAGAAPGGAGLYALELLKKNQVANAKQILSWAATDTKNSFSNPTAAMFVTQWEQENARLAGATMDLDFLEFAAATLTLSLTTPPAAATTVFENCAVKDKAKETCLTLGRIAAFKRGDMVALEKLQKAELALHPDDARAMELLIHSLSKQRRFSEAEQLVTALLAKNPNSVDVLRARHRVLVMAKASAAQLDQARDDLLKNSDQSSQDSNNIAWELLFEGNASRAAEVAKAAERKVAKLDDGFANTLAAIAAEQNDPATAWSYVEKSRAERANEPPTDADWYVIGRIMEGYGLRDDALAAYWKVKPTKDSDGMPSSYDFAQRNLKRLQGSKNR
jgi:cytochrome c-type biogenesis protein CcmH/NrfG